MSVYSSPKSMLRRSTRLAAKSPINYHTKELLLDQEIERAINPEKFEAAERRAASVLRRVEEIERHTKIQAAVDLALAHRPEEERAKVERIIASRTKEEMTDLAERAKHTLLDPLVKRIDEAATLTVKIHNECKRYGAPSCALLRPVLKAELKRIRPNWTDANLEWALKTIAGI